MTIPLAVALGLLIAVLYSFHLRFLNPLLIVYVDALRAFPVLVLLVLIFYGLPFLGINLAALPAAVVAIALNNSGYYGEIFRAGIEMVPRGQREAARSTGLSAWQMAFSVVLPQAVQNVLARSPATRSSWSRRPRSRRRWRSPSSCARRASPRRPRTTPRRSPPRR